MEPTTPMEVLFLDNTDDVRNLPVITILIRFAAGSRLHVDQQFITDNLLGPVLSIPRFRTLFTATGKILRVLPAPAPPDDLRREGFDISKWYETASLGHQILSTREGPGPLGDLARNELQNLSTRPFNMDAPLWNVTLVRSRRGSATDGDDDERAALVVRVHHAIVDGVALLSILANLLSNAAGEQIQSPAAPAKPSANAGFVKSKLSTYGPIAGSLRLAGNLGETFWRTAVTAWVKDRPSCFTGPTISSTKNVATATIRKETVKLIAKTHKVTVNDVLLSTMTGALREVLIARGETKRLRRPMNVVVPFSYRREADGVACDNETIPLRLKVPLNVADPVARLAETSRRTESLKQGFGVPAMSAALKIVTKLPRTIRKPTWRHLSSAGSVCISSLPGPATIVSLGGQRIESIAYVPPAMSVLATTVGFFTYNGNIDGIFRTDDVLLDSGAGPLAEAWEKAIRALANE